MYSFYIVYTFVVAFYGFVVPFATPIVIIIFFLQYWVDKYNLFKRFSSPAPFGVDLIRLILKCFEFSLLFFTIGFLFWDHIIHFDPSTTSRILNIVNLAITVIYASFIIFVPPSMKKKLLGEDDQSF